MPTNPTLPTMVTPRLMAVRELQAIRKAWRRQWVYDFHGVLSALDKIIDRRIAKLKAGMKYD